MCRKATEPSNQGEEISLSQEHLRPLSLVAHAFVGRKYILGRTHQVIQPQMTSSELVLPGPLYTNREEETPFWSDLYHAKSGADHLTNACFSQGLRRS